MYRVLVVDDEAIITDSLVRMLSCSMDGVLDVYPAYSGMQALDLMGRAGFDLVITDIQMPGLSGVELLKRIQKLYPACRVIFLSGHDEFEFAYQALQYHATRYVLKNEGDEVLLEAVNECLREIDRDAHREDLVLQARQQLAQCAPILRREYLAELLTGTLPDRERLERDFRRLGIVLTLDEPIILLAARLDQPGSFEDLFDLDALVREQLGYAMRCEMAAAKPSFMLWLMQPRNDPSDGIARVRGMADMLQRACAQTLSQSVSFMLDAAAIPWRQLAKKSDTLYHAMICMMDRSETQAFIYFDGASEDAGKPTLNFQEPILLVRQALDASDSGALDEAFSLLMLKVFSQKGLADASLLLLVSRLNAMILGYMEEHDLLDAMHEDGVMRAFLERPMAGTRRQQLERFPILCHHALEADARRQRTRQDRLVKMMDDYIEKHLSEELSLVVLSEHAYLNPSYLSRRYKELTGRNLSDAITQARMNRACEMLRDPSMKIRQIAEAVGYTSATHFTRVFHHTMDQTPQEWRDRYG